MKYYAVKRGRIPGIYENWQECQKQITKFPDAEFKSFSNINEAKEYLEKKASQNIWKEPDILLFSDGGSRNHGNYKGGHVKEDDKAAWAFLIHRGTHNVRGTGGEFGSTNNRMELMALRNSLMIIGRRKWNNEKINAILDSKYVLDAIRNGWLESWYKNGWKKSNGKEVINVDLWKDIYNLLKYFPNLKFQWTKGHADNKGNNIVDKLLNETMDKM